MLVLQPREPHAWYVWTCLRAVRALVGTAERASRSSRRLPVNATCSKVPQCSFGMDGGGFGSRSQIIMNSEEQVIRLIQLYGKHKVLWDPKDPKHLNKFKREDCWREISAEMQCSVNEIKKKMDSFLG